MHFEIDRADFHHTRVISDHRPTDLPDGHVLLVGHEPSLSARVRRLLGLERAEALELSKGALACVKTADRRTGSLKFLLTPKSLGVGEGRPA